MPGNSLRREVCTVLLRQRHLSAVLLRVLLGGHPLARGTRVSQTPGEGGRRPTPSHLLPLELSGRQRGRGNRGAGGQVVQESQIIVKINALFCCWFLFALISLKPFSHFFFKLIYIYILKIEKKNWNYIQICPARKKMCNIILFMCLILDLFL